MTQSAPFEVKAGETFTLNVKMDMDGVAPGEYAMKMELVSSTPTGKSNVYDTIMDVGHFVITDDPQMNDGFRWEERLWGNFRMRPLKIQ